MSNSQKRTTRHAGLPVRDHNSWRIRWIDTDGKRRSRNYPSYKKALENLTRLKGEVQAVRDGTLPKPGPVPTFSEFVKEYYLPNRNAPKRSPRDDVSILCNHLTPLFGAMPLNRIGTRDAIAKEEKQ